MILALCLSSFQVNPNREELRPEHPHCHCIPGTARQLSCQPALPLTRIVIVKEVSSARVPVIPKPLTEFQTYMRITLNVAHVSRLRPMLCH